MKKLIMLCLLWISILGIVACSIDKMDSPFISTFSTEIVNPSKEFPAGGYYVYFFINGELTDTIFLSNGTNGIDGRDGKDGINGIDGIDGQDGASVSITTQEGEGGTWMYIQQGTSVITIFIADGSPGADGIDGIDGTSSTITTEEGENGYWLIFLEDGVEINRIFIEDGADGANGQDGQDGQDGSTISVTEIEGGIEITITTNGHVEIYTIYHGTNGTNGEDGMNSITTLTQQGNCIVINTGLDVNGNYILDAAEILYTEQLCDCNLDPCDQDCEDEGGSKKVEICHQRTFGNNEQYFTIYVAESAVSAHLAHGDNLGECKN